jgi:hypothetical protein
MLTEFNQVARICRRRGRSKKKKRLGGRRKSKKETTDGKEGEGRL